MSDEIKVWNGHHPKPVGPTLMGCGWLVDHFRSVFNHFYSTNEEIRFAMKAIIFFGVVQVCFDIAIVYLLLKLTP